MSVGLITGDESVGSFCRTLASCVFGVNRFFLCVPSQKGISVDPPHRHQAWTTFPLTVT